MVKMSHFSAKSFIQAYLKRGIIRLDDVVGSGEETIMATIIDNPKPRIITLRFERLVEKCGLKGVRFHDLRHFGASYLHSFVPEYYLLVRGGWSTPSVMKTVYRHALESEQDKINKNIVQKVSNEFFE